MSGFFSSKWLKYSGASSSERGVIEQDVHCTGCGYNLRGLRAGQRCPECGHVDDVSDNDATPRLRKLVDLTTSGEEEERSRWKIGLTILTLTLAGVLAARFLKFSIGIGGFAATGEQTAVLLGLIFSVLWTIGATMALPPRMEEVWPRTKMLRRYVLWSQPLWIVGYALWSVDVFSSAGWGPGFGWSIVFRASAGVGAIVFIFLMYRVASDAELTDAEKRLNAVGWFLPIATVVAFASGLTFPWIVIAILFGLLLWWGWLMLMFTLAIWEMRQHVAWSIRHAVESSGRSARIEEKRRAMESSADSGVRNVPESQDEIAMDTDHTNA